MSNQGTIDLISGRTIRLDRLNQHSIYSGLLEGLPTRQMNDEIIQGLVNGVGKQSGAAPYLVPPVEKPIDIGRKYPFGDPASLPSIACVGHFDSIQPARDKQKDCSSLVIIWFQDDYAFPIAPKVFEHIRQIDWNQHARDYEL